jgi:HAD superfamily hydrolase (TIGR01509 family)
MSSPNPLRAVLFDLDGVLVETFDAWMEVVEAVREQRGHPRLGHEAILRAWGQGLDADCRMFFPGLTPAELARLYEDAFARHLDRVRTIAGAAELLGALRAAGVRCAVVTNSPVALAHGILRAAGLAGSIEQVVGGDEVAEGKPNPAMLRVALERLGIAAEQAVMIGDTMNDIEAARAARILSIGYRQQGDARVERLVDAFAVLGLEAAAGGAGDAIR